MKEVVENSEAKGYSTKFMDYSTPIGIVLGIAFLIFGFTHEGGVVGSLVGVAAFLIVFGGTAGAVIASFPLKNLKNMTKWLKIAFASKEIDLNEYSEKLVHFAEKARREGLLSLQQDLETIDDPFTYQGMQLIIDGTDPETTQEILSSSIEVISRRHKVGISVFEAAGGFAPTLGIIGTVMGLIQVLGNLSDAAHYQSLSPLLLQQLYTGWHRLT